MRAPQNAGLGLVADKACVASRRVRDQRPRDVGALQPQHPGRKCHVDDAVDELGRQLLGGERRPLAALARCAASG
eukprot:3417162-Rhodomonas_salina.2